MIQSMTDKEEKFWNKRLRKLYKGDLGDIIKAILMDSNIGGFALFEGIAEAKMKAIIHYEANDKLPENRTK